MPLLFRADCNGIGRRSLGLFCQAARWPVVYRLVVLPAYTGHVAAATIGQIVEVSRLREPP